MIFSIMALLTSCQRCQPEKKIERIIVMVVNKQNKRDFNKSGFYAKLHISMDVFDSFLYSLY